MYDITKLKEIASMFHVEVDLWGTEQDRLTMSGKTSDINKFWEAAEKQGLLGKDPFDESYKVVDEEGNKVEQGGGFTSKKEAELFAAQYGQEGLKVVRESYNPEETSWIDDLIDVLRTYPSNDEIENDAFLKELRELYYKHYPDSDKIIEEETLMERMSFDTLYQKVKEQDRPIQESLFGTLLFDTSFANELYDEFYKPLTDLIKKGDKEGAMKEWQDIKDDFDKSQLEKKKWARTFIEVQKDRMKKYKAQIDAMEDVKIEEPALVEDVNSNTRNITIEGVEDREECPYLLGEDSAQCEIANRYDLTEDELWCTGWVGAVQNCNAGPFNSFDELDIYCYDQEKGKEYTLPEIPEDIKTKFLVEVNRYITEVGTMEEGYKPHTKRLLKLIGSDKLNESDESDETSESSLPEVTWTLEVDGDILGTDYDDREQAEESLKEYIEENELDIEDLEYYIYEDFESLNQDELANYLADIFEETYKYQYQYYKRFAGDIEYWIDNNYNFPRYQKPDIEKACFNIAWTMCEILEERCDKSPNDLDDYEESYKPISEDIDDEYNSNHKAENVEFVMNEYISDELGIESVTKVNDTTYKVIYNGTEVEIVFDFGWDEWVYTINAKGPFSHSSYEWLISDIRSITDQESIDESFNDFGDFTDKEAANELGGEMIYCDTCGTKLAFDEYGSYCPKCSHENPLDDTVEELHESGFDTHSDIDLDMVGTRVANLLDEDNLGDDWIEFDCKDSRGLIGTPDIHMSFEATGSDKVLRGYMRAHPDDTIDVYITNGSEGKFRSPREIARFIAGEFGLFNHNI